MQEQRIFQNGIVSHLTAKHAATNNFLLSCAVTAQPWNIPLVYCVNVCGLDVMSVARELKFISKLCITNDVICSDNRDN